MEAECIFKKTTAGKIYRNDIWKRAYVKQTIEDKEVSNY